MAKIRGSTPKGRIGKRKERLAFADAHELATQDVIQAGGDTSDIEAAFAEQEPDRFKEQKEKDPSFGQTAIICKPSTFEDAKGHISDEFRPLMKCTLCKKDPTKINEASYEIKKFYSMTSHVTFKHDMCV